MALSLLFFSAIRYSIFDSFCPGVELYLTSVPSFTAYNPHFFSPEKSLKTGVLIIRGNIFFAFFNQFSLRIWLKKGGADYTRVRIIRGKRR